MKKILGFGVAVLSVFIGLTDGFAAKKQAAINLGTKVRGKVEATGVYNEECYEAYYGCMDQFCIVDNEIGGSCNCSDDVLKYESALNDIKKMLTEAERIGTEEVEKVQAGANADIIFKGTREYDKDGNVIATKATKDKNEIRKSMWSTSSLYDVEEYEEDEDSIFGKVGNELYNAANEICKTQIDSSCEKDMKILTQMYSRQIASDCKGLANSIDQKKSEAKTALNEANRAVRAALKESLEESNRYDRGTCMVEYKKCMRSDDACGADWGNCVFTIASENMQNNASKSVAGTKVATIDTYDITPSTMEILEAKRFICERVLDSCVAVRDLIWNDFLREAAPTIRLAEQNVESKKRQSCLSEISNCIQTACKDDIAGKGTATMDACLARPDMARSFCKIQIDPCERMEPQIWDYVKSKLAALRVDACTQEVKECFTSEDRCGADFANCIGMDYDYIHDICPIDKLVVCKQANPDFKMSDLDDMLMGLYLNIDNKELEICEERAEMLMTELCGSTTDCNSFAADEYIGTSSINLQTEGSLHRIVGLISFGKIKMGDASGTVKDGNKKLAPGEIGVQDYIKEITKKNKDIEGADVIIASIADELNNIAGTINRTISLIEADQRVQYCINGRDLSQIKGVARTKSGKSKAEKTEARFPNLLNQYRVEIAMAALRKAQDNYNKKWSTLLADATRTASNEVAQYMCNRIAEINTTSTFDTQINERSPLTSSYSIVYDVSTGLVGHDLLKGGGTSSYETDWGPKAGMKTDVTSTFSPETRICHVCRTISTKQCEGKIKYRKNGNIKKDKTECKVTANDPVCEDIQM